MLPHDATDGFVLRVAEIYKLIEIDIEVEVELAIALKFFEWT